MTRIVTREVDHSLPLLEHRPDVVWLSPTVDLVGWGEAHRLGAGFGPERFDRIRDAFAEWVAGAEVDGDLDLPAIGPVGFTSITFDPRSAGSVLVVPAVIFARRGKRWFVTTVDDADPCRFTHPAGSASAPVDRPRYAGASIPDVIWLEAVAEATRSIAEGPLEKVVLARDFAVWSKSPFDPRRILQRLHERFPDCYTFLVDGLVGASPELLVRRTGQRLDSVALAGSARRSDDPEEDERIGHGLLESDKDRREHEMAARSVAEALGEMCDRVVADAEPSLLRLANVQHLATQFRANLSSETSVIDVVRRLHPTAAVGGWPTAEAVEAIRRLEGMNRGRYAGPVGWFDARGDGEFAIALRCAELSGARARLFAGAGIVRGSLPESELEETRLKLQAMLAALEA